MEAPISDRRVGGRVLGWVLLGLLVVLLGFELIMLIGFDRGLPSASSADADVAGRVATSTNFTGANVPNKSVSTRIVAGPRVQSVSGGRATFLVVVDQTIASEGSQSPPQLVHTGLLVTVQEKNHKVGAVRVL